MANVFLNLLQFKDKNLPNRRACFYSKLQEFNKLVVRPYQNEGRVCKHTPKKQMGKVWTGTNLEYAYNE